MRISDWSSDVCSSDLMSARLRLGDVQIGLEYLTPGFVVTEAHIVNFAGISGDFFDVHMDDQFAQSVGFPTRVAHGLLCLSLVDGLKNRSEEHTSELQSLMRISYAVFCLKKKKKRT